MKRRKQSVRVSVRDPLRRSRNPYILGPARMEKLLKELYRVTGTETPLRFGCMMVPEMYRVIKDMCEEHYDTIRQHSEVSEATYIILDELGLVELPARLKNPLYELAELPF